MKKYFIGSMAVIMAIAASAFTVAKNSKAAGDVFVNRGSNYEQLDGEYNPTLCSPTSAQCSYQITSAGASHISNTIFPSDSVSTYLANGWIVANGMQQGEYDD